MSGIKQFFKKLTAGLRRETWWFTEHELRLRFLRSPKDAWGDDPFVAYPPEADKGVIVLRNGQVTDAWEDGERGVPPAVQEAAKQVQMVLRPTAVTEYGANWAVDEQDEAATERRSVVVGADGRFWGFAPVEESAKAFLLGRIPQERWCFTDYELEHPEGCRSDDEFLADLGEEAELAVVVLRNGQVTDRWEDGTGGVPPFLQDLADCQDTLYKPAPRNRQDFLAETWRGVSVKKHAFAGWA